MKIRSIIPTALSLLCAVLLLALLPTEEDAKIYDDTVRLHVLAASDSEEDQAIKLRVRDRLLATYGGTLAGFASKKEAEAALETLVPEMERDVCRALSSWGKDYGAHVTFTTEEYDTRVYDAFTLPAGRYASVRVILGNGEGHNWWCVMYPPLCLDAALSDDALSRYSETERRLITKDGYAVRFRILELIEEAARTHKDEGKS